MTIETLLSRLDGVKKTGPDKYMARCPAHADKHPSLGVRELADGRIIINDFGGCSPESVLSAIGLTIQDLFPERLIHDNYRPEKRPFPAMDVLRALRLELLVILIAAKRSLESNLTQQDMERLTLAVNRVQAAIDYVGGS